MGLIKLRSPVKHGVFENEQDIIAIFNHLYSKLGINSQEIKEHSVLVTEPLLNPYTNREKIAYSLIDNLGVPAIFLLLNQFYLYFLPLVLQVQYSRVVWV